MELRNRANGQIVSEAEFRQAFPSTSFPKVLTPEIIDDFGYDCVLTGTAPTISSPYETVVRDGVEEIDGKWFTKFRIGPVFVDYETEEGVLVTAQEQQSAYIAGKDEAAAKSARQRRNGLLSSSDWTQVSDAPVDKAAWAAYRQELRDLTNQAGFPWEISWPVDPDGNGAGVVGEDGGL